MTRIHGTNRTGRFLSAVLLSLAACVAGDRTIVEPDLAISDGAHSGGTAGFFFLPPMVWELVTPTGEFDPTVLPDVVVRVCELTGDACGVEVARFSASGPPFGRVTVSQFAIGGHVFEQYLALWRTDGTGISANKTYRVTLDLAGRPLGFSDVRLVRTQAQAEAVDRTQFTVWVKGLPLPIRFRIETGIAFPPGDAQELELTGLPASLAAGAAASVTVTARDANGNVATGFGGTVTFSSSDPQAVLPADYTFTAADAGVHAFTALSFKTAGAQTLRVADAATASMFDEATVTVVASEAVAIEVAGLIDPTVAGTVSSITVTARDVNGNIATGYVGTVGFTSSDPQATLPEAYAFTAADAGTHAFPASVTLRTAGSHTVTATDAAVPATTGSQSVTVTPAAAAELVLSGFPDSPTAGVANDLTVTVRDQFANTATGYAGTVQFSSSDPAATIPAAYEFQASDAGVRTFAGAVTFRTSGLQSFTASDAGIPASTSLAFPVSPAAAAQLQFSTQPTGVLEGATIAPPVVVTARDAFNNVATAFTAAVTIGIGANPGGGTLAGSLQADAALGVATFGDLSINADGVGYTLVASAAGLTSATSDLFTVTAVAPTEAHWGNALGGSWRVGANWSTGTPPTPDQAAFIDLAGTYTVTLDVNATVRSLSVGAGSGAQTLSAGSSRVLGIATAGTIHSTGRLTLSSATINGPGVLTNAAGGIVTLLGASTLNGPLANGGTLLVQNSSVLNGTFTTAAGSLLRVQSVGFGGASLTVASGGFTNHGAIELTGLVTNGCSLTVNGTLVNAVDGTISSLTGCSAGGRLLGAQLDNQGTLNVTQPLTLNRGSADHVNSGTIVLNADFVIPNQGGTSPSFTNLGTVTVAPGRTWSISNSAFTQAAGATLDGGGALSLNTVNPAVFNSAFALSALSLQGTTVTFTTDITTATLALSVTSSTINGPITLTNAATKTVTLAGTTTINTALANAGTLVVAGATTVNGSFSTLPGSLLQVRSIGFGGATLNVPTSLTNNGTIELTGTATNTVTLNVNGTLVNSSGGTLAILPGVGGLRNLNAQLDNQGTFTVAAGVTVNRAGADHVSSGNINVSGGDLSVVHTGTTPSFTNSGAVTLAAGRALVSTGAGVFTNGASGIVSIAIGGTATSQFGRIAIAGTANLAGTVDAQLVGTFAPATGDRFRFMTFAARTGTLTPGTLPPGFVLEAHTTDLELVAP